MNVHNAGAPPGPDDDDEALDERPPGDRRTAQGEVLGSDFDAHHAGGRRVSRSPLRRLKQWLSWHLVGLFAVVWPRVYEAYCRLVWSTCVVTDDLTPALEGAARRHGRAVCLLWHQEVFTVAWAYRALHGHTLASAGNMGRVITHMLERCNFTVFRGGSSAGTARRRRVLPAMIRHMREWPTPVIYGITVDGSNGPPWVMKPGGPLIARACRAPVFVVRLCASRRIELPTWDRTVIPLPFGRISMRAVGPYWIDPDSDAAALERFSAHLEGELRDLTHALAQDVEPGAPLPSSFPPTFRPAWPAGAATCPALSGTPFGPHDLRPYDPPSWAAVPGEPAGEDRSTPGR